MGFKRQKNLLVFSKAILCLGFALAIALLLSDSLFEKGLAKATDFPECFDSSQLLENYSLLKEAVRLYNLSLIVSLIENTSKNLNFDCHTWMHQAGFYAYQEYGPDAFDECTKSCHYGCYHGVMEAYILDRGTEDAKEKLGTICEGKLIGECYHGAGHGALCFFGYNLQRTLGFCDSLGDMAKKSCWDGVFMENAIQRLNYGSEKKNIKEDDPFYPCNSLEEKYQKSCYFQQIDRLMDFTGGNFTLVIGLCRKYPQSIIGDCMFNVGRRARRFFWEDAAMFLRTCKSASPYESECMKGGVEDIFWKIEQMEDAERSSKRLEAGMQ